MALEGKVAIVTGGNSGIGKAIVLALAGAGANVVIDYVANEEATEELERQIAELGEKAIGVEADVSKVEDLQRLIKAAVDAFGRLDVMVNNAGIETRTSVLDTTEAQYDKVLDINLKSAFFGTQLAAKQMIAQGTGGRIINISSVHEDWPMPANTPYCLSKGGMRMLTRTAGVELAPHGINVVGVGPGAVDTPINAETEADPNQKRRHYEEAARQFDEYVAREQPDATIYQTRGLVRAKLRNHVGAVDDFTRALELAPKNPATRAQRGWELLLQMDSPKLALRDFEEVIKSTPSNADAYNGRGLCRVRVGPYREAVADAEEAIRLGPATPFLLYNAARIFSLASYRIELEAAGKPDVQTRERRRQHEDRALTLLAQALESLPAQQRLQFWHESIEKDTALNPIRVRDGYKQLAGRYASPK